MATILEGHRQLLFVSGRLLRPAVGDPADNIKTHPDRTDRENFLPIR
jgi:hypothetical protein